MNDTSPNRLREARTTFNHEGAVVAPARLTQAKTYRAKVFKSGNSLALRLPSALGLEAGIEMELTVDPAGGYSLTKIEPPRPKIDVSGFWGKCPGAVPPLREDFEERPSTIAARKAAARR
jgi:antitoxin VapB